MRAISSRQVDVLRWIAEGTPDRAWPDYTHRTTAKALQSRGLAKVRGHGPSWTAEITELGQRVLDGEQIEPPTKTPRGSTGAARVQPLEVDPEDLLQRVREAPGRRLVVATPDASARAGYRRAIAAIGRDLPDEEHLTYRGRDAGDLVIALVERPDHGPPEPDVPIPKDVDPENLILRHLVEHPDHLEVSDASRDRALQVLHGLAEAFVARGHTVGVGDSESSMVVTVDGQAVRMLLREAHGLVGSPRDQRGRSGEPRQVGRHQAVASGGPAPTLRQGYGGSRCRTCCRRAGRR